MRQLTLALFLGASLAIVAVAASSHWNFNTGFNLTAPDGHCALISLQDNNTLLITPETCE